MITCDEDGGRARVTLPGALDTAVAAPLKDALAEALERGLPVVVDASDVARLSTACIQVLIAGGRATADAGRAFIVIRPSEALVAAFDDMGLFPVMMKWKIET
jgi:anti-anti-sigma factor